MTRRRPGESDPLGPDGWDGDLPEPPADQVDWQRLLDLLPAIDARRDAPPDPPRTQRYSEDGILQVEFSGSTSSVAGTLSWLAQTDLVRTGFDWGDFVGSPRGRVLIERVQMGTAGDMTLEECRLLLVALARQERFSVGAVDGAVRSGFVGIVLRRAQQLLAA